MNMIFRPLTQWPRKPTQHRKRASFHASYSRTLIDLDRELHHLRAKSVIIQAACAEDDIRLDGRLRSSAVLSHPGIVLTIETPTGTLNMPCDTYQRWEDNLRAIVLTLQKLRDINRYGVTQHQEQYAGWKPLPPGGGIVAEEFASVEAAARVILQAARRAAAPAIVSLVIENHDVRTQEYRAAAKNAHPDKPDGSAELMSKVNRAMDFLEKHAQK